ncbi:MAG: response regulator, partial [Proteobacteria bacterium]|nr:response regulator [Pseudomonadota bacterium]
MNGLMVVDDEEGVRRSLKKVLERDGYRIVLAENGEEALSIIRSDGRDIETVISDYRMPGMDGLETLIEIGRLNTEITRIMLTGYATMASAIEAVNEGIDGFLTKPFENDELRAKVREYNIKKRLKQFVSEQVLIELQRSGAALLPKRVNVSVLFTDIRGFTSLSEKLNPTELSDLLNLHYFSPLDDIIFRHNGTLDKHIGDSIMG